MKSIPVNTIRISFVSFMAYFVISAIISPLGILSKPIAEHYDVSLTAATSTFSYLTSGLLVGCLIAIYAFDHLKFKRLVIGSTLIAGISLFAIYAVDTFFTLRIWLAITGVCCGIQLSAAAVVITQTYSEKFRASMLLLTDSFYSISGVISTFIASIVIAKHMHFSIVYALPMTVTILAAVVAARSKYSVTTKSTVENSAKISAFPFSIHLIAGAIFMYLIGFVCIYSWVPNYAQQFLNAEVAPAGQLVSQMFLGMFFGQLATFFIALKCPIKILLVVYTTITAVLTIPLWTASEMHLLQINMFLLGLIGGGLYKILLAYATIAMGQPSPKLVSYLIFSGAVGSSLAPAVSAYIVDLSDASGALKFASLCYTLTCILFLCSVVLPKLSSRQKA